MAKKIVSAASVPFALFERIRWDTCKIGIVFFNGLQPMNMTNEPFELVISSSNVTAIKKTNEQLVRTASNRIEWTLTQADQVKLSGDRYKIQVKRLASGLTELAGELVWSASGGGQAGGLPTPPDVLIRYVSGQPDPEATYLVVQGPQGDITPALEQLRTTTVAAKDAAAQSATTASTKAGEASGSATTASNKAGEASGSATTASTKAGEALASANAAAQSATTASNKAGEALASANAAAQSATTASNKAGEALSSANAAQAAALNRVVTATIATTYSIDLSLADNTFLILTLTANTTLTIQNAAPGKCLYIDCIQGGAGSFVLTFPAAVAFPGGAAIDWNTTAGKCNTFSLMARSSTVINATYAKM